MKRYLMLLIIVQATITTSFSWAQEKASSSYIPFTNQIGCEEVYDIPTLGEIIASCDTLFGDEREMLLQELEDEFSSDTYMPEDDEDIIAGNAVVLSPMDEDAEDAEDDYAIKKIIIDEDEEGDIIKMYILRKDGWLRSDLAYRSMEYIDLAGYVSYTQHLMFITGSRRLR